MDNQIKTSFIPRKPITTGSSGSDIRSATYSPQHRNVGRTVFSLIATIIFLVTIAGYGAMFFWQNQLNQHIVKQEADMRRTVEEFDERFITQATRLDTRIKEGAKILENHVAPSALYSLLSAYTLETISFSDFAFTDMREGGIRINATGEASRFESIVLQSDSFGRSGYLRNVLFTGLNRNLETGRVEFAFEATLDPRLILYKDVITNSTSQ